ncbi:MAG: type II toxin-antitoxin system VapC family toxin, partial [Anaerolineales bacterium]
FFAAAIEETSELIVPTMSLYEVFKRVLQQRGEGAALQAVAVMFQGRVIDLDMDLALSAAKVSVELNLLMADKVMLATAQTYDATFYTQDRDFENIEGVRYIEKR